MMPQLNLNPVSLGSLLNTRECWVVPSAAPPLTLLNLKVIPRIHQTGSVQGQMMLSVHLFEEWPEGQRNKPQTEFWCVGTWQEEEWDASCGKDAGASYLGGPWSTITPGRNILFPFKNCRWGGWINCGLGEQELQCPSLLKERVVP